MKQIPSSILHSLPAMLRITMQAGLSSLRARWKRRPLIAKILTIVSLLFGIWVGFHALQWHDFTGLWFVAAFVVIAITAQVEDHEIKSFLFTGALALSHLCLQIAARLNGIPSQSSFELATISGHTSKEDPAEPPVTIDDLLQILDRSIGKSVELEIPGYRIKATTVTALDEFIEKYAGREGTPAPEPKPWFAER